MFVCSADPGGALRAGAEHWILLYVSVNINEDEHYAAVVSQKVKKVWIIGKWQICLRMTGNNAVSPPLYIRY